MGTTCCCQADDDKGSNIQEVKAVSLDNYEEALKDTVLQISQSETQEQAYSSELSPTLRVSNSAITVPIEESSPKSAMGSDPSQNTSAQNLSPISKVSRVSRASKAQSVQSVTMSMIANDSQEEVSPSFDPNAATIRSLEVSADPLRAWFGRSIILWRDLPIGDACEGNMFLEVASTISGVYPYVFSSAYAQRFLTKDLGEQVDGARKHWPEGAKTCREAVRGEIAKIGVLEIEKRYWNSCTCRLLWVCRAMRIQLEILQSVVSTDVDPVKCAQNALNTVCGDVLSSSLKKIADFIIWFCVFKKRVKLFEKMGIPEPEAKSYIAILLDYVRPHAEATQAMFDEEVPSVVKKRP